MRKIPTALTITVWKTNKPGIDKRFVEESPPADCAVQHCGASKASTFTQLEANRLGEKCPFVDTGNIETSPLLEPYFCSQKTARLRQLEAARQAAGLLAERIVAEFLSAYWKN